MGCKNCPDSNDIMHNKRNIPMIEERVTSFVLKCGNNHDCVKLIRFPLSKCSLFYICDKPARLTMDYCHSGRCENHSTNFKIEYICPICDNKCITVLQGASYKIEEVNKQPVKIKSISRNSVVVKIGQSQ